MARTNPNRVNVTLDDAHAEKLRRLADRTHKNEGTLARSLLMTALDAADLIPATLRRSAPFPWLWEGHASSIPDSGGRCAMLITTMNDVPGHEITDVYGEVFGLTVRSRNAFSQLGAGLKSMLGGELKGMTKALVDSRMEVVQRMKDEAEAKGGNAIVAMRFDTSEMGPQWTEICAYGTAVKITKA